jgi:hypothetical protein
MTALSTYFAVNKFLRMKFDQLYYWTIFAG